MCFRTQPTLQHLSHNRQAVSYLQEYYGTKTCSGKLLVPPTLNITATSTHQITIYKLLLRVKARTFSDGKGYSKISPPPAKTSHPLSIREKPYIFLFRFLCIAHDNDSWARPPWRCSLVPGIPCPLAQICTCA